MKLIKKILLESSSIYKDWDEFVNPHYILVYLKNGKTLKIERKRVKGGSSVYNMILKAFNDNNYKITDAIVKKMIDNLGVKEITTTGDVAGYDIPAAFDNGSEKNKKKKREISTQLGYEIMDDGSINESRINRWHELRKEATINPSRKLAKGLREIKWQLREMGKFLNWYNRVKDMNEISTDSYLKTTHRDIKEIENRLRGIQKEMQKLGGI